MNLFGLSFLLFILKRSTGKKLWIAPLIHFVDIIGFSFRFLEKDETK